MKTSNKHEVDVTVEKGNDNTYTAYISGDNKLPFGILGEGNSVDEAINDFKESFEDMRKYYDKEVKKFPENVEFTFKYDLASFLSYYSKVITLSGLEKLTGVNQGQLSHYVTGRRKPSKKTVDKIKRELHNFAEEISKVEFI